MLHLEVDIIYEQTLKLEAEPTNKYDKNAILIVGHKKGLLWSSELTLGYLPREIAAEVTEKELGHFLLPRPKEVWTGDRGGFSFVIDLVGPRSVYKEFDAAKKIELEKQYLADASKPATGLQKEYYRFFGIGFKKGITTGQADEFIQKHRSLMTKAGDPRLKYWDSFLSLWEELSDSEVREDLDIKKPSLSLARKTFSAWIKEEEFCQSDLDDTLEFVDKLLQIKPDLQI